MAVPRAVEKLLASLPDPDTLPLCPGCALTEDQRERSEKRAELFHQRLLEAKCDFAAASLDVIEGFLDEVGNWEDMAILETEKLPNVKTLQWLRYLNAFDIRGSDDLVLHTRTSKYADRLMQNDEWLHVPGSEDLHRLMRTAFYDFYHGPPLLEVRLAVLLNPSAMTWHDFNVADPHQFAEDWAELHG